jgi:hypothetical protein
MASENVQVQLRFPTVGKKRGDKITVSKEEADRLIAAGSASAVPAKSDKG